MKLLFMRKIILVGIVAILLVTLHTRAGYLDAAISSRASQASINSFNAALSDINNNTFISPRTLVMDSNLSNEEGKRIILNISGKGTIFKLCFKPTSTNANGSTLNPTLIIDSLTMGLIDGVALNYSTISSNWIEQFKNGINFKQNLQVQINSYYGMYIYYTYILY